MKRIHTLTANLLWETTFYVDAWSPGETIRAVRSEVQAGGKGVNVSKALNRLGADNETLFFPGGKTGQQCLQWLESRHFRVRAFPTPDETRTGLVVRGGAAPETTFLGPDSPPGAEAIRSCCDYLERLPDGSLLAVCGSLPGWDGSAWDPLRATLETLFPRLYVAVDTYGAPLRWFAQKPVGLIKINRHELRNTFGDEISIPELDARAWIVTDGSRKISGFAPDCGHWETVPPAIEEVSPVGSGDVFFAALLHGLVNRRLNQKEAAREAILHAAANAASPGIADYSEETLETIRKRYRAGGEGVVG